MKILNVDKRDRRMFVQGINTISGRPHMEAALVKYIGDTFFHCLIYRADLDEFIMHLQKKQLEIREKNPRWKEVDIHAHYIENRVYLKIGSQTVYLQEVKNEIESFDEG